MLDSAQRARIRAGFDALTVKPEALTRDFYARLFELAPETRALFGEDIGPQADKLQHMLVTLVLSLDTLEAMIDVLEDLGALHADLGTEAAHYALVGQVLLQTLAAHVQGWSRPDAEAWTELYRIVSGAMIDGARAARGGEHRDPDA